MVSYDLIQKTRNSLCYEPDEYNLYLRANSLISVVMLYSHLRLSLPSALSLSAFPTKPLYAFYFPPYVTQGPSISLYLIWSTS